MKSALRWVLRVCFWTGSGVLLIALLYGLYGWVAYRDLSVQAVSEKLSVPVPAVVQVEGMEIYYQVEGEGPPLLMLHSHFWNQRMFDDWAQILAESYTVIRFDLPGHGFAGADPTGEYSKTREVSLALGLLDHLGVERAHILGSSTGAAVAYRLAAAHADRVHGLVLINAPGLPKGGNPAMRRTLPDWALPLFYLLPEAVFRPFLGFAVVNKDLITPRRVQEAHTFFRREGNRRAEFMRLQQYNPDTNATPVLAQVAAPTLILWGEQNPQLPLAHAHEMAAALTGAASVQVISYPGLGHVLPVESPQTAALDVQQFLESLQ